MYHCSLVLRMNYKSTKITHRFIMQFHEHVRSQKCCSTFGNAIFTCDRNGLLKTLNPNAYTLLNEYLPS